MFTSFENVNKLMVWIEINIVYLRGNDAMDILVGVRRFFAFLVAVTVVATLGGCGSRLLKVEPGLLKKPKKVAVIWTFPQETPKYIRTGQGLLDMVISEATKAPWIKNIETFSLGSLVVDEFGRLWKPLLDKYSVDYRFVQTPVNMEMYRLKLQRQNEFWADAKAVVGPGSEDYLVVFQIQSFDVQHYHGGFVSFMKPVVLFKYKLTVIRVADNQIVGEGEGEKRVDMKDGWDKGPDYAALYETMAVTFSSGMTDIYKSVIGE